MRNERDAFVETSRWDVSNHGPLTRDAALPTTNISRSNRSAFQNGVAQSAVRNVNETFHRNVSTDAPSPEKPTLFKERYRIQSTRLPGWDYTASAYYFVTICTFNREPMLGTIVNGKVVLTPAGEIADEQWRQTAVVRANILLDEYVIMPNHIHGILAIKANENVETSRQDVSNHLSPQKDTAPNRTKAPKARLAAGSLGAIIGQFKSVCTKRIRQSSLSDFSWQTRFYEHIIRNDDSLHQIQRYIADNPLKWKLENEMPANLWM